MNTKELGTIALGVALTQQDVLLAFGKELAVDWLSASDEDRLELYKLAVESTEKFLSDLKAIKL